MQLTRHVGKFRDSGRRLAVVYMQIPEKPGNALIIDVDRLPDEYHDVLMKLISSEAAQNAINLANVLDRRASPDPGLNMMNALHQRGFLRTEPIGNIIMLPRPNQPISLAQIIDLSKDTGRGFDVDRLPIEEVQSEEKIYNLKLQSIEVAKLILSDAKDLEDEAARKRKKAYEIAPSLVTAR